MPDVVVPQEVAALGYQQMETRKRIALAMMTGKKKGYPKNVGEGLASIGDSMGDIGMMRMLEAQEAARQEELRKAAEAAALEREAVPPAGGA